MPTPTLLFSEETEIKLLNVETVLSASLYPTSGNFILVGGLYRFAFLIAPGVLGAQQTWQVQQAVTINGTPKDITGAVLVVAGNGDNKPCVLEVEVAQLDINNGYKYVTLKNTGGTTGNYSALLFLGWGKKEPVTQDANYGQTVVLAG